MSARAVFRTSALALALLVAPACVTARIDRLAAHQRLLEAKVDTISAAAAQLRLALDSLQAHNDSLRRTTAQRDAELLERDEQIRALRLELRRLKDIDLRPRQPR